MVQEEQAGKLKLSGAVAPDVHESDNEISQEESTHYASDDTLGISINLEDVFGELWRELNNIEDA